MYRRAVALMQLGDLETGGDSLVDAIAAFRATLEVQKLQGETDAAAITQWDLGHTLTVLGNRVGDRAILAEAATVLEATLAFYPQAIGSGGLGGRTARDSVLPVTTRPLIDDDKVLYRKAARGIRRRAARFSPRQPDRLRWGRVQGELGNASLMARRRGRQGVPREGDRRL